MSRRRRSKRLAGRTHQAWSHPISALISRNHFDARASHACNDMRITHQGDFVSVNSSRKVIYAGPDDNLLNASFDFVDGLAAEDVEKAISRFERRIKKNYPSFRRVFIEAQGWRAHLADARKDNEEVEDG